MQPLRDYDEVSCLLEPIPIPHDERKVAGPKIPIHVFRKGPARHRTGIMSTSLSAKPDEYAEGGFDVRH